MAILNSDGCLRWWRFSADMGGGHRLWQNAYLVPTDAYPDLSVHGGS
jgi:hypothetical protein